MYFFFFITLQLGLLFSVPCSVLWPNSETANVCQSTSIEFGPPQSRIITCNESSTIAISSRYNSLDCTGTPIDVDQIILAAPCKKTECLIYTQTDYIGDCQKELKQATFKRAVPASKQCVNGVTCSCDPDHNAIVSYYLSDNCENQPIHSWVIGNENKCLEQFGMRYQLSDIYDNPCLPDPISITTTLKPTLMPTNKPTMTPIKTDSINILLNKQNIDKLFDKITELFWNLDACDQCWEQETNENNDNLIDRDRDNSEFRKHGNSVMGSQRQNFQHLQNQNRNNHMYDPTRNIGANYPE